MLLTAEPLTNGHFDRGYPLSEVKLYCHGPVGTTEPVLYIEIKCTVSFSWRVF